MIIEILLTIIALLLFSIVGGLWHLRKNSDKLVEDARTSGYLLVMIEQSIKELLRQKDVEGEQQINDDVVKTKHQTLSQMAKNQNHSE